MQKIIIAAIVAIIAIIALFWWLGDSPMAPKEVSSNEQVSIIAREVLSIEAELSGLAASTETGTFTATAAQSTRSSIATKLNTIETAYTDIDTVEILAEEQSAMVVSADTMKILFSRYQNTLVAIDTTAGGDDDILAFESITKKFINTTDGLSDQTASSVRTYNYQKVDVNAATALYIDQLETAQAAAEAALEGEESTTTSSTTIGSTTMLEMAI